MSPVNDNTSYITTTADSIDYAYYDRQARMARSLAFGGSLDALKDIFRIPRLRFAMPVATRGCGPLASPCG